MAYSTVKDFHLLNVPAAKMGAFPDDIEHFHRWLAEKNYAFKPNDFVPRRIYGEYLRELFSETFKNKNPNIIVNVLDDEAIDVLVDDEQMQVVLKSGEILYSDRVVLAFGNFLPPHPKSASQSFVEAEKYFRNPWRADLADKISESDDVFIIGTGLTFADVVMSLYHNNHKGKIIGFSTRGLLPAVHRLGFTYPSFADELKSQTRITDLLKIVRRHVEKAESDSSDWRAVIDSLRPQTQEIWQTLPEAEKRYFMQHLSRYWNVARHRIPPECAAILDELQEKNQLQILKGRLRNIETNGNGKFEIAFTAGGAETRLSADAVVNCIGSESNFNRIESPLVKSLLYRGLIKTDRLKMGIDAVPDGRTIDKNGAVSEKILTVGTALKGVLWESTAMPEIRAQTHKLALSLLNGRTQ
ncbi:MAG TPA: FAD/NAD(P)-binding protein [Pyrinomonadaceae bacterium]|nr:FAD/NAD(P)-binding protein [Pyrinomonadaceae bacterium]